MHFYDLMKLLKVFCVGRLSLRWSSFIRYGLDIACGMFFHVFWMSIMFPSPLSSSTALCCITVRMLMRPYSLIGSHIAMAGARHKSQEMMPRLFGVSLQSSAESTASTLFCRSSRPCHRKQTTAIDSDSSNLQDATALSQVIDAPESAWPLRWRPLCHTRYLFHTSLASVRRDTSRASRATSIFLSLQVPYPRDVGAMFGSRGNGAVKCRMQLSIDKRS